MTRDSDPSLRIEPVQPEELPKNLDAWMNSLLGRVRRGNGPRRQLADCTAEVVRAKAELTGLDAAALREALRESRRSVRRGRLRDDAVLVRALALVAEVARRELGLDPYPVQLQAAVALLRGFLAEMATGEGKTLAAGLAAAVNAWTGYPCHVITANDYLAERDAGELRGFYRACGVRAAAVVSTLTPPERREAYRAAVCYTTSKEIVADYLRDRLVLGSVTVGSRRRLRRALAGGVRREAGLVMRGLHTAIVDEADSVLVDEAVTPLIISRQETRPRLQDAFGAACAVSDQLSCPEHYTVNRRYREIDLQPAGEALVAAHREEFPRMWQGESRRLELVRQALQAREFYRAGEQYVVQDDRVVIIDEFTGRAMPQRTWRDGLHQAVEIREGLPLTPATETLARMSFQRFFRSFHRLSGMTGTAREAAEEFWQIYRLPVVRIPLNTPSRREALAARVYRTRAQKRVAVVGEIRTMLERGRPVLVGLRSVAESEALSRLLVEARIEHEVLNAVRHREEARIILGAGQSGRVTLATNLAGRGTDIRLGAGVARAGGLHVVATEMHEAARIDRQLIGRCARQGDPGSYRVFLSLEDPLLQRFGSGWMRRNPLERAGSDGEIIGPATALAAFRRAQKVAEKLAFKQRKSVLRTDHWLEESLGFAGEV